MELHPLCTLFPRMDGDEFESLVNDIKENGLLSPIVLLDGMILDGGNRYRACLEAGIEPEYSEFVGESAVSFVLSVNLHRRHMTAGQQASIVSLAQNWSRAHTYGGDRKSDQAVKLPLDSVEKRTEISGVSEKTQRNADKLARENPDLARKVAAGEISLNRATQQTTPHVETEEPEEDYTEVDMLNDRIAELEDMLATRLSPEEGQNEAAELIKELRARIKSLEIELRAVTKSRDDLMVERNQMLRQIKMLKK